MTPIRNVVRSLLTVQAAIRLAITVAAVVAIAVGLSAWIGDRTSLHIAWLPTRPIDLLRPAALYLIAIIPVFYLLRVLSLTDLSLAQQLTQATLRSLVITGIALALARPSWITEQSRIATIALIDVSDSVSDRQLDAARSYVDSLAGSIGDGSLQLITFAEQPIAVRGAGAPGAAPAPGAPASAPAPEASAKRSAGIARHLGRGAGTDIQAAMQLAYGMYPDGYLPRMVIVSDGNQTQGDVAVEAYRAKELGVRVSWRTFDQDETSEIRVVGVTVPDEIKVGQPFEVTAEVWSTEAQKAQLTLQQDEFPNGLEPAKDGVLGLGLEPDQVQVRGQARRRHHVPPGAVPVRA